MFQREKARLTKLGVLRGLFIAKQVFSTHTKSADLLSPLRKPASSTSPFPKQKRS